MFSIICVKGGRQMVLQNNNHSVFSLHYHLVLALKNRQEELDEEISNRLKEIFERIQGNYNIACQKWEYDKHYVHVFFSAEPNTQLSKFINAYKSASSRLIKKEFGMFSEFWSKSFCLLNSDESIFEHIKKYLESQIKN